jgi:hypothetical protein
MKYREYLKPFYLIYLCRFLSYNYEGQILISGNSSAFL